MPLLEIRDTPVKAHCIVRAYMWTLAYVVEFSEVLFMSVWSTFDDPTLLPPACLLLLTHSAADVLQKSRIVSTPL